MITLTREIKRTETEKQNIYKEYISTCSDYYTFVQPNKILAKNVLNLKYEEVKDKDEQMLNNTFRFKKELQKYFDNGY